MIVKISEGTIRATASLAAGAVIDKALTENNKKQAWQSFENKPAHLVFPVCYSRTEYTDYKTKEHMKYCLDEIKRTNIGMPVVIRVIDLGRVCGYPDDCELAVTDYRGAVIGFVPVEYTLLLKRIMVDPQIEGSIIAAFIAVKLKTGVRYTAIAEKGITEKGIPFVNVKLVIPLQSDNEDYVHSLDLNREYELELSMNLNSYTEGRIKAFKQEPRAYLQLKPNSYGCTILTGKLERLGTVSRVFDSDGKYLSDLKYYLDSYKSYPLKVKSITNISESAQHFSEGFAGVRKNGQWGFINTEGQELIPCLYENVIPFSEGLTFVKMNDKYGLIDSSKESWAPTLYSLSYRFENATPFSEGLSAVMLNGKWGYINHSGTVVIPCIFEEAGVFIDGIASVRHSGSNYDVTIDKQGCEVLYHQINRLSNSYKNKDFIKEPTDLNNDVKVMRNDGYDAEKYLYDEGREYSCSVWVNIISIVNSHGEELFTISGEDIWINDFCNGLAWAKLSDSQKPCVINQTGDVIFMLADYEYQPQNVNIIKDQDGKYGCINILCEYVIPCQYDFIIRSKNDEFAALKGEDADYFDIDGVIIYKATNEGIKYETVNSLYENMYFNGR